MLKLKEYFKSKEFIISISIILVFIIYNIGDYIYYTTGKVDASFPELVNCFAFWRHTMYYNGGSVIMFLSPFIISIVSSTEGCSTITGWKRRSRAESFSICFLYSSSVVAPMT